MDVPEIKDRDHLEAWLKTRSREECIAIAHRAAMRVAPITIGKLKFKVESLSSSSLDLFLFRPLLISGVAAVSPSPGIVKSAADYAAADYLVYAVSAHNAAAAVVAVDLASVAAYATAAVADRSDVGPTSLEWEAAFEDLSAVQIGIDPLNFPCWRNFASPFTSNWTHGRTNLVAMGPDWDFWDRWYDAAQRGEPLNWKMQEEIALLPSEVWEGDVAGLAAAIATIEAKYRLDEFIEANPYAIRVLVDQRSRKLIGMPLHSPNLEAILEAIRTALSDFTSRCKRDKSPNRYGLELLRLAGPVLADLRRDLKRYRENPLALFDALGDGCRELQNTAKGADIPKEGALFRLVGTIDRQALDIIGAAPSVLETVKRRNAVEFELLKRDQLAQAIRLCSGMQADSKDWLQASAALAIQIVSDPSRSTGEKQAAWYFMRAVIPRGAKAKHDFEEAHPKKKPALQRAGEIADTVVKLDRGIDAAQEIATEGADWVAELTSQIMSGNWFGLGS